MGDAHRAMNLIRPYLERHTAQLEESLWAALAEPMELEPGRRLQFEVCPYFYRVTLCVTEYEILPDDWLGNDPPEDVLEQVEQLGSDPMEVTTQAIVEWLADGWEHIGGPARFQPAFAFFHGYHDEQFDLVRRCWVSAEEAFAE